MQSIRQPAVAGLFYSSDPQQLQADIEQYLQRASHEAQRPKALIVPHAGLVYSGPVAAHAYKTLIPNASEIQRVVLLGPSHRVALEGIALSGHQAFHTPLGDVPVDAAAIETIRSLPGVLLMPEAHQLEHSLEVQLPFLQTILPHFSLIPLVVGNTPPETVCQVLDTLWGDDETLIVISTDLSHYHSYEEACLFDGRTTKAIERFQTHLRGDQACGCHPLNGLLMAAKRHGLKLTTLDVRNSGDTVGTPEQVVGYGAYVLH
ncbi:Uncharacterised protein [BD1-7 clade bacterium]|uniref:MEMO1 family protein DPBNPPHM_00300 n=1 Tax=BD1-7 clade bacterium TaxID=2029982 RepID=A0A5S9N3N9_9GAMM|nr:Uncharacterised protein [BD1-7 clade bacterium]CAA0083649.1 Uncharacterised protein [BD1-7 clade bacterium]